MTIGIGTLGILTSIIVFIATGIAVIVWYLIKRLITGITVHIDQINENIDNLKTSIMDIRINLTTKYVTKDDLNHEISDSKSGRKNLWEELKKLDREHIELKTQFHMTYDKGQA